MRPSGRVPERAERRSGTVRFQVVENAAALTKRVLFARLSAAALSPCEEWIPMTQDKRPSWDEYFMTLANQVATRTTCMRRGVGAVIVKERRILATGYNGVPAGLAHCAETGCLRQQLGVPSGQRHEICRGLHAEQNAIIQAARYGINIAGASIYINTQPCVVCAKMIINADIEEIIYQNPYPDELAMSMLEEAGIKLRVFEPANK